MDRWKSKLSKILLTTDLIADEKMSIQENLNRILDQLSAKAYYLKTNSENLSHRNVSHVQKYILKVYQQFCEINSALDVLLEDSSVLVSDASSINNDLDYSTKQIEELVDSSIYKTHHLPFTLERPGTTEIEVEDSNYDIQNLKKSLSEFSEKLGLNQQNLSEMKYYFEKTSTAFQSDTPETILMPGIPIAETNQHSKEDLEIPEKDTNTDSKQLKKLNADDSELTENILHQVHSASTNPTFSNSDTDTVTKERPKHLHNCTAIEKLNNFKLKECKRPASLISSSIINLKPSGTMLYNYLESVQEKKQDSKKLNNIYYDIKLKEIPKVGEECVISFINSPDEFYIHVVDTITTSIDQFHTKINNYCRRVEIFNYTSKEDTLAKMGKFCLALMEHDKAWYRVEILRNEENEDVLVRLVDYGNKELVSYKNLFNLTEEFSSIPMLAIKCHFPRLYPPESTGLHKLTTWPTSSINAMNDFCEPNQNLKIVYALREENDSVAIDFSCYEISEDTIGQLMIDFGFAVQIIDDYDENNVELDIFLDDVDTVEVDNINEAVLGYDPRDEARICRFTNQDGNCYKGKECKLDHVYLPKDGFTTDKEAVFTEAMYSLTLPPIDSTVMILITGYIDTCRFFGQIIQERHNEGKYIIDRKLYLLMEEMKSAKTVKTYETFKISPALGEIVLVNHYRNWLRAVVRDIRTNETGNVIEVKLFMADLGENITASIKDIRRMKPHFLKLPFQAVEFYIYNYQMKKNCSAQNAHKFFINNLYLRNFRATTKSSNSPLKVELTNLNGCMIVGHTLEQEGYAERRIMDMHILETCNLDLY